MKYSFPLFDIFNRHDLFVEFLEIEFHDKFDGLIGNNILEPLNVTINYANRTMTTADACIQFYLNEEEEIYFENCYKESQIEIFNNDVTGFDMMRVVKRSWF